MESTMLNGPETFQITYDASDYRVLGAPTHRRFGGTARSSAYKLYVVCQDGWPIYVGVTKQSLAQRFRLGWKAKGQNGYHGYDWRHTGYRAQVDLWTLSDGVEDDSKQYAETVEAEVVLLIRNAGQWPKGQTEIHFHESTDAQRAIAKNILDRYTNP